MVYGFRHIVTGWFLTAEDAAVASGAVDLVLIVWPLFLVNGTNIVVSCYLTAIHQPRQSALIAMMRSLVLPASLLVTLYLVLERTPLGQASPNWSFLAALPVAEWTAFVLACALCYRHRPSALSF